MSIAVITSIYGDYDPIPRVPAGFDEAILVTDNFVNTDWKVVVENRPLPNILQAKIPKFRPDLYTDCDLSLWVDASCQNIEWHLDHAEQLLEQQEKEIVVWQHPERNNITDEANFCHNWDKYKDWNIQNQIQTYINYGMPNNFGLWACGSIARKKSQFNRTFGDNWLAENIKHSIQDQISFAYLIWKFGALKNLSIWPENQFSGPVEWNFNHNYSNYFRPVNK